MKTVAKSTKAKISHIVGELQDLLPIGMHRFIEMQLRMSQVKNFGQQWKLADKVFAMSIFYQSKGVQTFATHILLAIPSNIATNSTAESSETRV